MTIDRLQAAWRYAGTELWRPLFAQFADAHTDLPVVVVRTLLIRPRGMATIFVDAGQYPVLDALRGDAATYLDSVADARSALRKIRPQFFVSGRAIVILLADIAVVLEEYGSPNLEAASLSEGSEVFGAISFSTRCIWSLADHRSFSSSV